MQLDAVSSSNVLDEKGDRDLHILVMDPDPPLTETDVVMESVLSSAIQNRLLLPHTNQMFLQRNWILWLRVLAWKGKELILLCQGKIPHLYCLQRQITLLSVLLTLLFWIVL